MIAGIAGGEILTRLGILAGGLGLGTIVWLGLTRLATRRLTREAPDDPLLADVPPGLPVIVYFSTPHCVPCRTQQQPVMDRLASLPGAAVRIIQVDALTRPDLAGRWGVFTAPTTIVLDGWRTPRHVNRGVASVELLQRQLANLGSAAPEPPTGGIDGIIWS